MFAGIAAVVKNFLRITAAFVSAQLLLTAPFFLSQCRPFQSINRIIFSLSAARKGCAVSRIIVPYLLLLTVVVAGASLVSCRNNPEPRPYIQPPPDNINPTTIDYVDSDAFDSLFESALVTEDPVILIRTYHQKPDWAGRLNAWIAAWNMGGKVSGRTVRGQAPLPQIVVDGESIREFRFLVDDLMNRVENVARNTSSWWAEERIRSKRVALLRPYSLRFHMAEDQNIQLIFFNGKYAQYYPQMVKAMTDAEMMENPSWSRSVECSMCKNRRETRAKLGAILTSRTDP
jgi:hypothetical protein